LLLNNNQTTLCSHYKVTTNISVYQQTELTGKILLRRVAYLSEFRATLERNGTNCISLLIYFSPFDVNINMANVLVVRLLAALFYGVSSFMITVSNKVVLTSYK